jgi:hypothetical protein
MQETFLEMGTNNIRYVSSRGRGLESNVKPRVGRPLKISLHYIFNYYFFKILLVLGGKPTTYRV